MTRAHSQIAYGDNLTIQPRLARLVDTAVVKFINRQNDEPDPKKGLDDPHFHLPNPTDTGPPKVRAHRQWHGSALWMVVRDEPGDGPAPSIITRRVTVSPDYEEPDMLSFIPDIIVTRSGGRFILPDDDARLHKFRQRVNLFRIYAGLMIGNDGGEHADESIVRGLSEAWSLATQYDANDATVPIP